MLDFLIPFFLLTKNRPPRCRTLCIIFDTRVKSSNYYRMAVPKHMLTEFGIHYRLESCVKFRLKNMIYKFCDSNMLRDGDGSGKCRSIKTFFSPFSFGTETFRRRNREEGSKSCREFFPKWSLMSCLYFSTI